MMGLDFGRQLPVFGAFEKPPELMQIASHEVVGHLDTSVQGSYTADSISYSLISMLQNVAQQVCQYMVARL